jgi:bacterioferritin
MTAKPMPKPKPTFVADIEEIRKRARQHILDGAVTGGYKGDRQTVIKVLNEALATEIVCVLRYKRHHYTAKGRDTPTVSPSALSSSTVIPTSIPKAWPAAVTRSTWKATRLSR